MNGKKNFLYVTEIKLIDLLIKEFLKNLGDDVRDMLRDDEFGDNYNGLYSDHDRDTEKEVETAISFFPDVLTRKGGAHRFYPIQHLAYKCTFVAKATPCKVKAISFIPLVVRLAIIEFGLFEEQYRGGLLCQDNIGYNVGGNNVLQNLMRSDKTEYYNCEQSITKLSTIGIYKFW